MERRLTAAILLAAITVSTIFAPAASARAGGRDYQELIKLLERLRKLNPFEPDPRLARAASVFDRLASCSTGLAAEASIELSKLATEAAGGGLAAGWWRASQNLFHAIASMPWEVEWCPSSLIYQALYYAFGSVGSYTFTPPHGPSFASDAGQLAWWIVSSLGGDGFASTASSIASTDPHAALALAALLGRADRGFWTRVLSEVSTRQGLCLIFALAKPDAIPGDVAAAALSIIAGGWAQDPEDTIVYIARLMEKGERLCAYAAANLLDALMKSKGYLQLVSNAIPHPTIILGSNVTFVGSVNTPRLLTLSKRNPPLELAPATILNGRVTVSPSTLAALLTSTLGPALLPHYNTTVCKLYLEAATRLLKESREPVGFHAWNRLAALALLCQVSTGDESTVARLLLLQPYLPIHPGIARIASTLNPKSSVAMLSEGYYTLTAMGLTDTEMVSLERLAMLIGIDPLETGTLRRLALEAVLVAAGAVELNRTTLLYGLARYNRSLAVEAASTAAAWYATVRTGSGVYLLVDRDVKAVVGRLLEARLEGNVSLENLYNSIFARGAAGEARLEGLIPVSVDAFTFEVKALSEGLRELANTTGLHGGYVARLLSLVEGLEGRLASRDYDGVVAASNTLRDAILSNPRGFALLLLKANYTVGDAGLTLLAARASSVASTAGGKVLLSPETIGEVLARIEDAIARLYLHPHHPTAGGAGGEAGGSRGGAAGGGKGGGVGGLLEKLREALEKGDIVEAARLLAAIYASGNPTAVAKAVRIVEGYATTNPSLLRELAEKLTSKRAGLVWRGFHEPHLGPVGAPAPQATAGLPSAGVSLTSLSALVGLLAVAALAVLALRAGVRVRRRGSLAPVELGGLRGEVVKLFAEALSHLERMVGRARRASETVREYAGSLPDDVRGAYLEAVAAYEEARFSGHSIGWEHVERVRRLLRLVRWRRGVS